MSSILVSRTGLNKLTHISEDWGFIKEAVLDSLREDFLAVFVPFDVPD